jgi:hypothetical protein
MISLEALPLLEAIIAGFLGGIASALIWAKGWKDLTNYEVFRSIVLGAIGGYLYALMNEEWNLPDGVVAFAFGYAFQDIIEGLIEKILAISGNSGVKK